MKTVSLFVWSSCFKTWIIHNHLGNLRWNVPPLYDQVSQVSLRRSRKGHPSHKLCCQPPPDSGVSDASDAPLAKSPSHIIKVCSYSGVEHWRVAGRSADHRVAERRQNLWGLGVSITDQSEARTEARWPIRGQQEPRCASGGQESEPETSPAPQSALVLRWVRTQSAGWEYHEPRIPGTRLRHSGGVVSQIQINIVKICVNWKLSIVMNGDQRKTWQLTKITIQTTKFGAS